MTYEVLNIYNKTKVTVVSMKIKDLQSLYNVEIWVRNRRPDHVRVQEIASTFINKNDCNLVDGVICCWKKIGCKILYLYDGAHRYLASKDCPNNVVIVKIITTDDEQFIIDDFKNINKGVSVPGIFLDDYNEYKISVCNTVMDLFCDKWYNNRSPANRPYACNYNRDTFIENVLSQLKIDFELPNIEKYIFQAIIYTNDLAKDHVSRHGIKIYQKSIKTNFYIMYFNIATIKHNIEEIVQELQ